MRGTAGELLFPTGVGFTAGRLKGCVFKDDLASGVFLAADRLKV